MTIYVYEVKIKTKSNPLVLKINEKVQYNQSDLGNLFQDTIKTRDLKFRIGFLFIFINNK